jgi:hypothetical protein
MATVPRYLYIVLPTGSLPVQTIYLGRHLGFEAWNKVLKR